MLDKKSMDPEEYKADKVAKFLTNQKVSHGTYAKIRNLSDRRNKSPVPHADPIAWAVTKNEYLNYRSHVGDCLKHLEQAIKDFDDNIR